jgi:hypothetical protein
MKIKIVMSIMVCILVSLVMSTFPGCKSHIEEKQDISSVAFFPVQKDGYEALPYVAALMQGQLVIDNGYLKLKAASGFGEGTLIIWPPGSKLETQEGVLTIVNREGTVIAGVGENLKIGGGVLTAETVLKYTGQSPPEDCKGPYWLAVPGIYNSATSTTVFNPNPSTLSDEMRENPMLLPATIYANHYSVSVDEALKRLEIQNSFGETGLQTELSTQEPGTFGGLWLQHEPEFKIVVAFTRDGEATFRKHYSAKLEPFMPYFEVRTVKVSLAVLEQTQLQIGHVFDKLDIPTNSAVHVIENRVDFTVAESVRTKVEGAIQSGKLDLPEYAVISYVN